MHVASKTECRLCCSSRYWKILLLCTVGYCALQTWSQFWVVKIQTMEAKEEKSKLLQKFVEIRVFLRGNAQLLSIS